MSKILRYVAVSLIVACAATDVLADKKVQTPEQILSAYGIGLGTPALVAALSNAQPEVRENAAILLGRRKERSASSQLRALFSDPYPYARLAAAGALLEMGDKSAISELRQLLLQNKDFPAAMKAAEILATNGNDDGISVVVQVATTGSQPMDRVQAVRTLSVFRKFDAHKGRVIKELANVLREDADVNVRRAAASELQEVPSPEALQAFQRAANDSDPVIRGLAERYLKNVRRP